MKKPGLVFPFILFVLISCQDKEALAELETMKAHAELEEQNTALIEKYIEAWNSLDAGILDQYLDATSKSTFPQILPTP